MNKKEAKKRLMFIQQEDYNYLIYNLLLVLIVYKCHDSKSAFKDYRKIAYLIEMIGSEKTVHGFSQDELGDIYSRAQMKKVLLSHVLLILYQKGIIGVSLNRVHFSFDIWVNKDKIPDEFIKNDMFSLEILRLDEIKKHVRYLKILTLKSMVDVLYTNKNIMTWEV